MAAPDAAPHPKGKHLELPTQSGASRPRLTTTPSHLLPATALFHGPNSRNASHTSLQRAHHDDRSSGTPIETKPQHLPRPHPPTSSFSGPRPSLIGDHTTATTSRFATSSKKDDDFRADAVWAEMQRTLADVELSAMNSSHVFSMTHAKALEDLRAAQLGLALAWAKSETDDSVDEEFGRDEQGISAVGQMKGGASFDSPGSAKGHSRQGSNASNAGRDTLEQETERDIMLARRRREANDGYFKQVNLGVLDVVKKLDDVVGAMRRVEKESREIWNSSAEGESEDLGDVTETDESLTRGRQRGDTMESRESMGTRTESEVLTDSPVQSMPGR